MKLILILNIIFLFTFNLFGKEESNWEYFKKNFYSKPRHVRNQPILKFNVGLDNPSYKLLSSKINFKNTFSLNGHYGFLRIDDKIEELPDIFKHSSEFTFMENISSTFKNFNNTTIGENTDSWGFGFGYEDGFGIKNGNERLYLLHASGFSWTHVDFDIAGLETDEIYKGLRPFDEQIRFGMFYSGGLRYEFIKHFAIDLKYRKNIIQPDFEFDPWIYAYLFDNITQRWIDYFEPDFIELFGKNYIWIKFVYKNTISFITYKMRESQKDFPFGGENTLYYDSFKFGLVFIF